MPFCAKCGTEAEVNATFCQKCGLQLNFQRALSAAAPASGQSSAVTVLIPVAQPEARPRRMTDGELALYVESRRKSGFLAAFLNMIVPGAGYVYCGRLILGFLAFVLPAGMLFALTNEAGFVGLGVFVYLLPILYLVFVVDGFLCAGRYNRSLAETAIEENRRAPGEHPNRIGPILVLLVFFAMVGGLWYYSTNTDRTSDVVSGEKSSSQAADKEPQPEIKKPSPVERPVDDTPTSAETGDHKPPTQSPPIEQATLQTESQKQLGTIQDGKPQLPEDPSVQRLSAIQLSKAYDDDQASGDAQFKGKHLIVVGIVESFGKDFLSMKDAFESKHSVRCNYTPGIARPEALAKGGTVTVQGIVKGRRFTGRVDMDECKIVQPIR